VAASEHIHDGGPEHHRVAIIGAGFGGIGMAVTLMRAGYDDLVVLERAGALGGTWRDNTYPGCQCDVPSHLYSFSFAPKHDWTRAFGLQGEIWQYLEDCADRFGVRPHIRLNAGVRSARWDEEAQRWHISTAAGELTAEVLVSGMGALSEPSVPSLPGLETFEGTTFHSATWRHDHDLTGERVAVIGTGASAIQFVPAIRPKVGRLMVFQRTPPWVLPRMDRPIGVRERARFRRFPLLQKAIRLAIYWARELMVFGFARWPALMRFYEALGRRHLARQVRDPELRAKLTPGYSVGCKRILISNEWYPALQRRNVEVVTERIAEIRPRSIVTADGAEREVDTIIFGTGFKVTSHPAFDIIHGRDGRSLGEHWRQGGMSAYKGTTVSGFPNLFILVGPNTGLGHSSIVFMMESQFAYVLDALRTLDVRGAVAADPLPEAQAAYNDRLQKKLARTVWNTGGCASWYLDAHGRNRTLWPGFTWQYRLATRRFDAGAYRLIERTPARREAREGAPLYPSPARAARTSSADFPAQ
jgi:cation diffusion facilitator CzcD-associated flavoprotein CzcO